MLLEAAILYNILVFVKGTVEVDPKGYILYCPCMGRFGNQVDQFLGTLAFAKSLDRTLVLPPWIEYGSPRPSDQIRFDTYFKVEPLREFHRVMLMEEFMKELAPSIWPPGDRKAFCFSERRGAVNDNKCNAKDGNPFGPFWDNFNVDFDKSETYSPLYYDTTSAHLIQQWKDRYPASSEPVMAFVGPPAAFPVNKNHIHLQKYMIWSDNIKHKALTFIEEKIERPFVGIHLRIGSDFKKACDHIEESPTMFAAAQCLGYRQEFGKATKEMCYPSTDTIKKDVKKFVKDIRAKTVFIATDSPHHEIFKILSKYMKKVKFVYQTTSASPHVDLAILQESDYFIGSCISTFTAIVTRFRNIDKTPTSFWAFSPKSEKEDEKSTKTKQKSERDEL